MKKIILSAVALIALVSCSSNWEYKIVTIESQEVTDFQTTSFDVRSEDLNVLGKDGWELVDIYTTTETKHPNFGNEEYVTGIRENTRTKNINYVFKRKK